MRVYKHLIVKAYKHVIIRAYEYLRTKKHVPQIY